MPIGRDVKKELMYESLNALSTEIALRFLKKPTFADDDFLEKLKMALESVGIDYQNIDMTYRLGFEGKTGIILSASYFILFNP